MKDEINNVLKEMLEIEESMDGLYSGILEKVKDEKVRKIVSRILEDEKKHQRNVKRMMELVEKA